MKHVTTSDLDKGPNKPENQNQKQTQSKPATTNKQFWFRAACYGAAGFVALKFLGRDK